MQFHTILEPPADRIEHSMEWWEAEGGIDFFKKIGLRPGQTVLDFGCRVGHYTIPAAEVVGTQGMIIAVDKEQHGLKELERKLRAHRLQNVKIMKTSGQVTFDLDSESIDVVLFYDVLHYLEESDRKKLYQETQRVLKHEGLFSVYPKHTLEDEPSQTFRRLSLSDVQQEIEGSNFIFKHKFCGMISHDDGLNEGCVFNFGKCEGVPWK